jgi:hypothetical protein
MWVDYRGQLSTVYNDGELSLSSHKHTYLPQLQRRSLFSITGTCSYPPQKLCASTEHKSVCVCVHSNAATDINRSSSDNTCTYIPSLESHTLTTALLSVHTYMDKHAL